MVSHIRMNISALCGVKTDRLGTSGRLGMRRRPRPQTCVAAVVGARADQSQSGAFQPCSPSVTAKIAWGFRSELEGPTRTKHARLPGYIEPLGPAVERSCIHYDDNPSPRRALVVGAPWAVPSSGRDSSCRLGRMET
jgi:hypothetical protein